MNNDILNLIYNYLIKDKSEINNQYKHNVSFDPNDHEICVNFNYIGNTYSYFMNFRWFNNILSLYGSSVFYIHSFKLPKRYFYSSGKNNERGFLD